MTQIVRIRGAYGTVGRERTRPPDVPTIRSRRRPPSNPVLRPRTTRVASAAGIPPHGTPPNPAAPAQPQTAAPDYIGQAQAQVSAQIDPMLQYIANKYNAQMQGSAQAIGGLTDQYAQFLGKFAGTTNNAYEAAKAPISGAAKGINAQLTAVGKANAARESAAMTAAGLPQGAAGADVSPQGLAQEGAGAGQAAGAIGQALVDSLAQAQKAAMQYASQMPSFAQAEGAYQTRTTLAQLSAEMADQMAQTTAQAPTLFWNIYNQLLDRAQHDKEFAFQVKQYNDQQAFQTRQYNDQLAAKRAGIVAPNAPTNAGRQQYWQAMADKRTSQTGYQWQGTTTGIRPMDADPSKPGIQPVLTLQGQAAAKVGAPPTRTIPGRGIATWTPDKGWVIQPGTAPPPKPKQPTNTGPYFKNPTTGKWELKPGYAPGPNGTVTKTKTPGTTKMTNTGPWYHNPNTKKWELRPGYHMEGGKVVKDTTPAKTKPTITGTAPRRVAPGKWVDRNGHPLSPAANDIWERKWRNGETDGHGKIKPPKKDSSSPSTPGLIKPKKPKTP